VKAAATKWREAQDQFEASFGVSDSAQLRSVLQRVAAI
jgi:hypothetical protein